MTSAPPPVGGEATEKALSDEEYLSPAELAALRTAWEPCWNCRGYGIVDGMWGPVGCSVCRENCYVRARDDKGRFTTLPLAPVIASLEGGTE